MLNNTATFNQNILAISEKVRDLPNCEMKYYVYILINSVKQDNTERSRAFLAELEQFTDVLSEFQVHYNSKTPRDIEHLLTLTTKLNQHLQNLQHIAQTHNFVGTVKNVLLNIVGVVTGVICGVLGGLIGAFAGFARGFVAFNPITGFGVGLFVGVWFGAIIGFRTPKKVFQNELNRQLRYGLNGLESSLTNNLMVAECSDNFYNDVVQEVRSKFDSDEAFQNFLTADVPFEIKTYYASFIGNSMLHKYVGHHVYVTFSINNQPDTMDFNTESPDTSLQTVQSETRQVKGEKLIEMKALHRKLQQTETATISFIVNTLKPGEIDCFTYVNKLLIATGQKGTELKRFEHLNSIGTKIGFFVEKLSPFKNDFFSQEPTSDSNATSSPV